MSKCSCPKYHVSANLNDGVAYIFQRSGTVWTSIQQLVPTSGSPTRYGDSLDISADGQYIVVGAPNFGAVDVGVAFFYGKSGNIWVEQLVGNGCALKYYQH